MQQIEFILNFSDKDGNKVAPAEVGLPACRAGGGRRMPRPVKHTETNELAEREEEYAT